MHTPAIRPANFTRQTPDLAAKLYRERRFGFLALYHLMRLSDLGREGIERSGSYRFADHLYANRASGRGVAGRAIDRILLNLPAACAMRQRCREATAALAREFASHEASGNREPFRVLTVPCGLPRDVRDFAAAVHERNPESLAQIEYFGLDLDPVVVSAAHAFLADTPLPAPRLCDGDALDPAAFPNAPVHFIASTGLGEFLDDDDLARLYRNVHGALAPGGRFFTSATAHDRRSDTLLRAFELHTHYRTRADIERLLAVAPWREIECWHDARRLQCFVRATKAPLPP